MATEDDSKVTVGSRLDRSQARSVVYGALTAVIRGLEAETLDDQQELYADLGVDSLAFAQLLVELEVRLKVQLLDEELMTIELVTVADLIDLVERLSLSAQS
jgi:acyl carrier protein